MVNGFVLRKFKKDGCKECNVKITCTRNKNIIYLPLSKLKKERF